MRLAWILLVAVGCDGPSDGADAGAAEPSPAVAGEGEGEGERQPLPAEGGADEPIVVGDVANFLGHLNRLRCEWAIRCETQAVAALQEVQQVSCGRAVRADFDFEDLYNGGLVAGRLTYAQPAAQQCIRELAELAALAAEGKAECEGLWARHTALDVCPGALVGHQEHGGPCTLDEECGPGGSCFFEGACPGVCIIGDGGLSLNEPCRRTPQCIDGLRCLDGSCRLAKLDGEACSETSECGPNLHCAQRGDPAGTCTPVGKEGEVCWADLLQGKASSCVGDLVCSGARRDNAGHCRVGLDLGDPCSDESPCRVGLRCVEDFCKAAVGPADLCREHGQCPAGLGCFGFECKAAGLQGERCDRDRACDQGLCVNGKCAFLPLGVDCEARSEGFTLKVCPPGYYCGVAPPGGEGEGEGEAEGEGEGDEAGGGPPEPVTPTCIEGPGFGEACYDGPIGGMCKEVLRCHGGLCGRPCTP